jgi:ribosome-binding protein aMBF1 (putative translation factor)
VWGVLQAWSHKLMTEWCGEQQLGGVTAVSYGQSSMVLCQSCLDRKAREGCGSDVGTQGGES